MNRTASIVGLLVVGAALIVAGSVFAGRVSPPGYCKAIGGEIAGYEARRARGDVLTRHERGYLAHWYAERAKVCGAPAPTPTSPARLMYL
jgi:hypothetical protein